MQAIAQSENLAEGSGGNSSGSVAFFEPAQEFEGCRPGTVFKLGHLGLGYYLDVLQTLLPELRPKLPEKWRDVNLREERLRVAADVGAGISLEHSAYGFVVDEVDEEPGQNLQSGEVIVAMEGRLLVGLSEPQMQASFQKRRVDGTRLQIASLAEVRKLAERRPEIVECWDAQNNHAYYFNKKTGKSSWVEEDLIEGSSGSAGAANATAAAPPAAPIDIASFLSHGFSKSKEPPAKKKKVDKSKAKDPTQAAKDESDRARDERERWAAHNNGGSGEMTYTEMFFRKYAGVAHKSEKKSGHDKRMKGSVGPGNGMEYMAAWTGSKNSFN